jgi:hypothetical protein
MKELKIACLPMSGEALHEWMVTVGAAMACMPHTFTKSLSNDLLSVFKKAVTVKTPAVCTSKTLGAYFKTTSTGLTEQT